MKEKRTKVDIIKQKSGTQLEHLLRHNLFLTIIIKGRVNDEKADQGKYV